MLLRKNRCGRQNKRLLAVDGGDHRGSHCDLSLAESNVAADQPIHRPGRLHVFFHGVDRRRLVPGLLVREARLELLEKLVADLVRVPLDALAPGVELEQLARKLARPVSRARLDRLPALAA